MIIPKRVFQKDPEQITRNDYNYCKRCGHLIDWRILTREEFHRGLWEQICPLCQREVEDPNPEFTKRMCNY